MLMPSILPHACCTRGEFSNLQTSYSSFIKASKQASKHIINRTVVSTGTYTPPRRRNISHPPCGRGKQADSSSVNPQAPSILMKSDPPLDSCTPFGSRICSFRLSAAAPSPPHDLLRRDRSSPPGLAGRLYPLSVLWHPPSKRSRTRLRLHIPSFGWLAFFFGRPQVWPVCRQ